MTTDARRGFRLAAAAAMLCLLAAAPDPRDLSGVWSLTGKYDLQFRADDVPGGEAPLNPAGRAIFDRRIKAYADGHNEPEPPNRCRPHGVPRIMMSPYPIEIVQTPGQVTLVHEVAHNLRIVRLDQPHAPKAAPAYMGDSVGHWDGDTLVVDTVGLRGDTWIDEAGKPHGARLHVVERFHKDEHGRMTDDIRIDDPEFYTAPWHTSRTFIHDPRAPRITEYVCEEADDFQKADR